MKKMNTSSAFPAAIDSLIFFQDISLDNREKYDRYQQLLNTGKPESAAAYLQETGLPYYGADLFRLIENRICHLQTYLKSLTPKTNPHSFSSDAPVNAAENTMWIA